MANKKFSEFTLKTDSANVDFVVGYDGSDNVRIAPSNLGGGATSLNGLTDCLVDTDSLYVGEVPSGLSGNPQHNTILGIDAGTALTTGTLNTLIGSDAGLALTNIHGTTAVGNEAGKTQNNESYGTYIGYQAGRDCTGSQQTMIGGNTRAYSGGGDSNGMVVVGYGAQDIQGGVYCTTVGYGAGKSNQGANTVNIGRDANRNNTAAGTLSVGYQAGYSQTSGAGNTNVGYQAGYTATTGGDNSFFGYHAGRYVTGNDNTAIGREAMEGTSAATNEYFNVAVGYQSLTNCAGAFHCATLGHGAGNQITSGSNLTVLGYNAQASSATATNEITLGNASVDLLRIPGLGSTDGHVLQYSSSSGGIVLAAASGGGASSLNGLSDCLVDTESLYVGEVPSGLSSNPQGNTILGIDAGTALTTGSSNTLIGHDAGKAINTAINNVIVGFNSGISFTNQTGNTVLGMEAGLGTSAAATTIGWLAGSCGNYAVTVGHQAGRFASSAYSVFIGEQEGYNASSGDGAIGIGNDALRVNTAEGNIAIGRDAGYSNTSGASNTTIGFEAGYSNTTNSYRTIMGYEAGEFNTGANNTFIGYHAGTGVSGSSTADRTTCIGSEAGEALTTGLVSTFIGYQAGKAMTVGTGNVAIGAEALTTEDSRSFSTACGSSALKNQNAAANAYNAAFGYQAGASISTGIQNTILGGIAANDNTLTTGSNNIVIGYDSEPSAADVDNEITLGNSSIATIRAQVQTISSLSDKRDKTNIKDSSYGLDLINSLKPVTFDWNMRDGAKVGQKDLGFIAQDLQELDDENLQLVYSNNPEKLEASYGRLIPVLVKAIQDLSAKVTELENK